MLIIFLFFGYQKWFEYEAQVLAIPFMPNGWAASAGRIPAMAGNVRFLMKDVVLLAAPIYLLKQDVQRALLATGDKASAVDLPHSA